MQHSLIWHDKKMSTVRTGNVDRVHYITVVKMFFWNGVTRVQIYLGEHQMSQYYSNKTNMGTVFQSFIPKWYNISTP